MYFLIFIAGIVAGFVGGAAAGGGLISAPILMLLGLPPHTAIGTNKLGGVGMTSMSFREYHKAGKIPYFIGIPVLLVLVAASIIGASYVANISPEMLQKGFGLMMLFVLALSLFENKIGIEKKRLSIKQATLGLFLFVPIGFFAGIVGGGQGVLVVFTLVSFFGLSFLEGNGVKSFVSFFMVGATALIFALNGFVDLFAGGILFSGNLIGSSIGAKTAINKGDKWVKNLFLVLVVALAIKLLLF